MSELSDEDIRRIERYLSEADDYEKDTALSSRQGFFSWLSEVGLNHILSKLIDLAWASIRAYLGF